MDVFYRANVTDGLFQSEWFMDDGKPNGGKFVLKKSYDLKSQAFFPPRTCTHHNWGYHRQWIRISPQTMDSKW